MTLSLLDQPPAQPTEAADTLLAPAGWPALLVSFGAAVGRGACFQVEATRHHPNEYTGLDRLLAAALKQARTAGDIRLAPDARELWHHAYRRLAAEPSDQLVAQITARAEAHVIRLALIYALTDGQRQIHSQHLTAALALQGYAARSAAWALKGATGLPLAEQIHAILRQHPAG